MVTNTFSRTLRDLDAMPNDGSWTRHGSIDGELFVTRSPIFATKVSTIHHPQSLS